MLHRNHVLRAALAAVTTLSICATLIGAQPALAQNAVSIVVNGTPVQFNQPPIERSGRIFVPLRGVFERLGASVRYDHGTINANGNGRNITLNIGSNQATINGQSQYIDVAPFLVNSNTLVPLRFVAQALGASVDWNGNTSTVTITGSNNNNNNNSTPPQQRQSFYLTNEVPNHSVNTQTPAIHATYSEPINPGSLRVSVNGRDITSDVYSNQNGFNVTPPFALGAGNHHVAVTGTTQSGSSFSTGWDFQTGYASGNRMNFIRNVQPANGSNVGATFNISGNTLPNSQVHIVATGQMSAFGGLIQIGNGTYQTDTHADQYGAFNATINLNNATHGSQVRVLIQSVAPDGSSKELSYNYTM